MSSYDEEFDDAAVASASHDVLAGRQEALRVELQRWLVDWGLAASARRSGADSTRAPPVVRMPVEAFCMREAGDATWLRLPEAIGVAGADGVWRDMQKVTFPPCIMGRKCCAFSDATVVQAITAACGRPMSAPFAALLLQEDVVAMAESGVVPADVGSRPCVLCARRGFTVRLVAMIAYGPDSFGRPDASPECQYVNRVGMLGEYDRAVAHEPGPGWPYQFAGSVVRYTPELLTYYVDSACMPPRVRVCQDRLAYAPDGRGAGFVSGPVALPTAVDRAVDGVDF